MKEMDRIIAQIARKVAENALKRDANQTTCNIVFQPKVPAGLNQFKKERR